MCPIFQEITDEARYRRERLRDPGADELKMFNLELLQISLKHQMLHFNQCPACRDEVTA